MGLGQLAVIKNNSPLFTGKQFNQLNSYKLKTNVFSNLISFGDMLDALVTEEDEVAQIWSSDLALKFLFFDLE
ncbi:hypothetical protein YC2023_061231 [Brassica napus]